MSDPKHPSGERSLDSFPARDLVPGERGDDDVAPSSRAPMTSRTQRVSPQPAIEFRAFYREHFRFVWRSLRRLGLGEHECPDAAQQVFMIVHRRLEEFRYEAKVTTWMFAICANVVANVRRSHGRRRETALDEVPSASASPHARTEARLTIERLLEGMPLEQRTAFLLFEVEQLTCLEIAEVTNTSAGTVKSRLRLARARIASQLGVELRQESELADE